MYITTDPWLLELCVAAIGQAAHPSCHDARDRPQPASFPAGSKPPDNSRLKHSNVDAARQHRAYSAVQSMSHVGAVVQTDGVSLALYRNGLTRSYTKAPSNTCAASLVRHRKLNVTAITRQFTAVHRLSCSEVTPTVESDEL
ncbi:hypothetical protein OPT61_g7110 [Boeremia exigua]|uniref:Uncharacterized protein n=1 Tax=Boeremia exigua TaxID=749465 RepID=A0ACC2I3L5_9PLEO|nr:hypothetical protein OPT61_g7110 [Boeremia exigua]